MDKETIPLIPSQNSFRFGDVTVRSLGMVEIELLTPSNEPNIPVLLDVVPLNVPALLGIDILDGEQLYADNVTNRLIRRMVLSRPGKRLMYEDKWHVPLIGHDKHLHARMNFPRHIFYTIAQLKKMHR